MAGRRRSASPPWLSLLEERLELMRENRCLVHEEGEGAVCLHCNVCPGLDLHFWRKSCKNCKCRMEEHDIENDPAKFEVLMFHPPRQHEEPEFGAGVQPMVKTNQPKLLSVVDPGGKKAPKLIKFDWVPDNLPYSMVIEFMNQLDSHSIPISGTQGAVRRRTQLKVQIPSHDYDLAFRATLSQEKKAEFDSFLVQARAAFGQGRVFRFSVGGISSSRRDETDIEVDVDPNSIPVLLVHKDGGEPHFADEQWKNNLSRDEVLQRLGEKERGQSLYNLVMEEGRLDGVEPEEVLEDYNPHLEYKVFLKRVEGINNCAGEDISGLQVIPCNSNVSLAEASVMYNEVKKCQECNCVIKHKSLAVATQPQHGALELIWHPKCFICYICGVGLADLYYFFSNKNVYCGRHFVFWREDWDRCGECDNLILNGEFTYAEDKCFHVEHFCCVKCDKVLANHKYILENGHPYCVNCFNIEYGKICQKCQRYINVDEKKVQREEYGDNGYWHATAECFRCKTCQKSLLNEMVRFHVGYPFCSNECTNSYVRSGGPNKLS